MKTLREDIDQLDEISRRDMLRGAGAAVAGAAGGVAGDRLLNQPQQKPTPEQVILDHLKSGVATGRGWTLDSYYEARDEGFTNEEIAAYLSAKSSGKL